MPTHSVQVALKAGNVRDLASMFLTLPFPSMQRDAEEALLQFSPEQITTAILDVIRSLSLERQRAARKTETLLRKTDQHRVVDLMKGALQERDLTEFAAAILASFAAGPVVEPGETNSLKPEQDGSLPSVQSAAVAALQEAASDGANSARVAVARALDGAGSDWGIDILCRLASDEDSVVRAAAASSLAALLKRDNPSILRIIENLVSDRDGAVRRAAVSGLAPSARADRPDPVLSDQIRIRGLIAALTGSDDNIRQPAADLLTALSSSQSAAVVALEDAAQTSESNTKVAVAKALDKTGAQWSIGILRKLAADENSVVRTASAASLAMLAKSDDSSILEEVAKLTADDDIRVRVAALPGLERPPRGHRPEPIPLDQIRLSALIAALADIDSGIRERAASLLGKLSPDTADSVSTCAAEAALSAAANDPVSSVRRAVITALSRAGGPLAAATLAESLSRDSELRPQVAVAILRLDDTSQVANLVLAALDDANPDVRRTMAQAITETPVGRRYHISRLLGNEDLLVRLARLVFDPDLEVRTAASRAKTAINAYLQEKRELARQQALEDERYTGSVAFHILPPRPVTAHVRFTAFHPTLFAPDKWYTLLVYVHHEGAETSVLADSQARLAGMKAAYWQGSGRANSQLRHGTPIRIVPRMAGAQFNPAYLDLNWLEDYHVAEFRVALTADIKVSNTQQRLDGTIEFRIGPLLIGEVDLWAVVAGNGDRDLLSASPLPSESSGIMYSAIFPSYAHEDAPFIEKLENAYSLLNLRYMRDVKELRAGDCWQPRLQKLIELADVFQLCWSAAAKTSVPVESEWRHALGLARQGFIKPIYWETPMPKTPKELEHLHFRYWHPS